MRDFPLVRRRNNSSSSMFLIGDMPYIRLMAYVEEVNGLATLYVAPYVPEPMQPIMVYPLKRIEYSFPTMFWSCLCIIVYNDVQTDN